MATSTTSVKMIFRRIDGFWLLKLCIAAYFGVVGALFGMHLLRGWQAERIAVHFQALNLSVYWVGVCAFLGVLAATAVTAHLAHNRALTYIGRGETYIGWQGDHVWSALIPCLIWGLIGARIYHILAPPPSVAALGIDSTAVYFQNPYLLLNFADGGLGIYGAMAGGAIGLLFFTRRRKLIWLEWTDLAVVGVALAQSMGRWGNFFNQELYGRVTNLPWAITIEPAYRLPEVAQFNTFHPAFLYESMWTLALFLILWRLATKFETQLQRGDLTCIYLLGYGLGRLWIESIRLNNAVILVANTAVPIASIISIFLILGAGGYLFFKRKIMTTINF